MNSTVSTKPEVPGFSGLGIEPKILEVLNRLQFKVPTPIQHKAIPPALEGKDLIGVAQTGTGKTLAFAIPMIQQLPALKKKGLVILPTRELAIQVDETFQKIGRPFGLKTAVLIGGAPMNRQIQDIRRNPDVVICTPGRMIDHLQQKTIALGGVGILVLDEADRMLDMGFAPQIKQILGVVPKERQTLLFSATMPDDIVRIATTHMKLPLRIEIARPGTAAENVEQEVFIVRPTQKIALLQVLLKQYEGTVLIFTRTKYGAKKICSALLRLGHSAAEIHSNRSLSQRKEALNGFKTGKYRVLVATDIASRGIDVTGIELVLNFDVPEQAEDYIHRIGRTARAGHTGRAITFAMPDQGSKVRNIERLMRMALKISKLPDDLPQDQSPSPLSRPPRPHHSGYRPKRHGPPQRRRY